MSGWQESVWPYAFTWLRGQHCFHVWPAFVWVWAENFSFGVKLGAGYFVDSIFLWSAVFPSGGHVLFMNLCGQQLQQHLFFILARIIFLVCSMFSFVWSTFSIRAQRASWCACTERSCVFVTGTCFCGRHIFFCFGQHLLLFVGSTSVCVCTAHFLFV